MSSLEEGQATESVKASKWHYYSMPANTEADFQATISSDRPVEVYLKKGITQDLPDGVNYDLRITNETSVTLMSKMISMDQGAIMAVRCIGEESDETNFKLQFSELQNIMVHNSFEFLDLAASAAAPNPKPNPSFERGQGMDETNQPGADISLMSDWQYMILGAFLGILATVIYYKLQKMYYDRQNNEPYRGREMDPKPATLDDPNKYLAVNMTKKTFREDEDGI